MPDVQRRRGTAGGARLFSLVQVPDVRDALLKENAQGGKEDSMKTAKKCGCRPAKRHRDCMYCGSSYAGEVVCGVCKLEGIDGRVIRGTERRRCSLHSGKASK